MLKKLLKKNDLFPLNMLFPKRKPCFFLHAVVNTAGKRRHKKTKCGGYGISNIDVDDFF
jgi:hypothetical protein